MKIQYFATICFLLLANQWAYSQADTIMLMKGKRIVTTQIKIVDKSEFGYLTYQTNNGNTKKIDLEDVYSVTKADGTISIFYKPLSGEMDEYTVEQMGWFLKGKADIGKWHFSSGFFLGGVAAGAAGAVCPPIRFNMNDKKTSVPIGVLIPVSYLAVTQNLAPTYEDFRAIDPNFPSNPYYLMGAQEAVGERRVRDSFWGTLTGYASGLIVGWALSETN